jgi:hypothetical protein
MNEEAKTKTSMEIRRDLWRKIRIRALEEGRPAVALVEEALERYLKLPLVKRPGGR